MSLLKGKIWTQRQTCVEGRKGEETREEESLLCTEERGRTPILAPQPLEGRKPSDTVIADFQPLGQRQYSSL